MLTKLDIKLFRGIKSISVDLKPLTVLIGPNDSGKSAFLDAIQLLANNQRVTELTDHWRKDKAAKVSIIGATDAGRCKTTSSEDYTPGPMDTTASLKPLTLFRLPSQGVSMQSNGVSDEHGPPELGEDGHWTPALFDYLLRRDRKRFSLAVDALRKLIPGLEEIEIATPEPHVRRLDLVIDNGFRLSGNLASNGVRLLLVFVALAYHPRPPKTILLEEPETGVHSKRLADVFRLLREITEGKHGGGAAQVILTTHSPYLLDLVNLETDQVLVFRRNADGSRTAEAADAERLKVFLDEFNLGEVWYNEGEEGLVAKPR